MHSYRHRVEIKMIRAQTDSCVSFFCKQHSAHTQSQHHLNVDLHLCKELSERLHHILCRRRKSEGLRCAPAQERNQIFRFELILCFHKIHTNNWQCSVYEAVRTPVLN